MPKNGVFTRVLKGGVIRVGDEMTYELPVEQKARDFNNEKMVVKLINRLFISRMQSKARTNR